MNDRREEEGMTEERRERIKKGRKDGRTDGHKEGKVVRKLRIGLQNRKEELDGDTN